VLIVIFISRACIVFLFDFDGGFWHSTFNRHCHSPPE
jgi:hypothetical protein